MTTTASSPPTDIVQVEQPKLSGTSPSSRLDHTASNLGSNLPDPFAFLPDFTEHPKPKRRKSMAEDPALPPPAPPSFEDDQEEGEVTFLQDFLAGGMAGSASVIVGHPLDTIKVRVQQGSSSGVMSSIKEFGGVSSLFRGMGAPLSAAAFINAIVFSSYGVGSKLYDKYLVQPNMMMNDDEEEENLTFNHDPWQKAWTCGSFAGLVQCIVICPMEHIKCRLQVQHGAGTANNLYKGPLQATRKIFQQHGLSRLYQGWWSTATREVPAFGLYFAVYDYAKDRINTFLARRAGIDVTTSPATVSSSSTMQHTHTWIASAFAGGCAGSLTWGIVYPIDVIKTRVQTAPLDTPLRELSMIHVGRSIVAKHGVRHLFRGLGITLLRAFPVNGTIFPVYEFTLMELNKWTEP